MHLTWQQHTAKVEQLTADIRDIKDRIAATEGLLNAPCSYERFRALMEQYNNLQDSLEGISWLLEEEESDGPPEE
jgi:predicted  nucleic acid-binding Zn-ribbon protein